MEDGTTVTEEEGEAFGEARRMELATGRSTRVYCSGGTCLLAHFYSVVLS
jgi:hypothetical protein